MLSFVPDSSFIGAVGYKPGRLIIQFKGNTSIYEYYFVPKKVYVKLSKSESVGAAFGALVKGRYPSRKKELK